MKMITERIFHTSKVMVWWLLLLPLTTAILCRPGHQYWNETLEQCVNCSKCPEIGHVVLRPCQIHMDTQCGPLSALDIDWSFLRRQHTPKPHRNVHSEHSVSGKKHHDLVEEGHLHLNRDNADSKEISSEDKSVLQSEELSEETGHLVRSKNKNSHHKVKSGEEKERRNHKKSHHKKWSSEESSSVHVDETRKHHKHHTKHSSAESHSINPRKHSHNKNKTKNHNKKVHWSSSEIIDSFEFPGMSNSSEIHFEGGHKWSFLESTENRGSFKKSNSSRKHSHYSHHHGHHSHSNSSEAHKNHGKKQKLQSLQEGLLKSDIHIPESASQLRESDTNFNASVISLTQGPESHIVQADYSPVIPKNLRKVNSPPSVSSAPFSATEELIWDWQAVALALAVFACLLFFIVACAYSVHHARQWRRLKDHFEDFEADVGELSTRLSLLLPAVQADDGGAGAIQTECCNNNSQCVYLEQLLARKRQGEEDGEHGNVYIDRDIPNGSRG